MIIIHCDASTKGGYSCYCSVSNAEDKPRVGIIRLNNSAAAEHIAIASAIEHCKLVDDIIIISDAAASVWTINNPLNYVYNVRSRNIYLRASRRLIKALNNHNGNVIGKWIASKDQDENHQLVDGLSKKYLAEFLKNRK